MRFPLKNLYKPNIIARMRADSFWLIQQQEVLARQMQVFGPWAPTLNAAWFHDVLLSEH